MATKKQEIESKCCGAILLDGIQCECCGADNRKFIVEEKCPKCGRYREGKEEVEFILENHKCYICEKIEGEDYD